MYIPKKYFIKTYGCQANTADSNKISGILNTLGFEKYIPTTVYKNEKEELIDILPQVDLFIINSCSVRQKSEDKIYGLGKIYKIIGEQNKKVPFGILAGCVVGSVTGQRKRYDFDLLKAKTSWVDLYMNSSQINELPNLLFKVGLIESLNTYNGEHDLPQENDFHAYINISNGCDNFCSYCVVPYSREEEVSRDEKEIIDEIKHLVQRGYSKFTLCGQNVNSWGLNMTEKFNIRTGSDQKLPFADLLRKVHAIDGITSIEFISSNPFDFTNDLIEVMNMPKISKYLHIAVQSGNNDVLKKMNRRHTVEEFFELTGRIKKRVKDIEFGTDIIVGFPGETREQFMDTVKLFEEIKFRVAYINMYSPRKGTPAERFFSDDVSLEEKKWRHKYLTQVWKKNR